MKQETIGTQKEAGLYIHWPYCLSKCPYCDFNSHVAQRSIDHEAWATAFMREIDTYADRFPGRDISSIFFGGGTPSLMAPKTVGTILNHVATRWTLSPSAEITLEANPGAVDYEKFTAFHAAGINRVSLGVQSFDDNVLAFLGRRHSADEACAALSAASKLFERFSFDLIYARPDQGHDAWRRELSMALGWATGGHLSLYQLTLEKGTVFEREAHHGRLVLPDDTHARALWDITQDLTTAHGLPVYEVSNHARPGQESRHNLIYWSGDSYIGIGPGAHGRVYDGETWYATRQHRAPDIWLDKTRTHGHATQTLNPLSPRERAEENVMMGLRLVNGLDPVTFPDRNAGVRLEDILDMDRAVLLQDSGFLHPGTRIRLTPAGMPVLDAVLRYLFCTP